jgi:hypothetical protein
VRVSGAASCTFVVMATHTFTAELERWGRVYGVAVPTDVSVALGVGGHVAVVGTVNGVDLSATLVPLPGARHHLLLNNEARDRVGAVIGDTLDVVLTKDPSNRVPPVPDDFAAALDIVSARARFDALPRSHRREYLLWIADAVKPETRSRRIARTVARVIEDV